MPEPIDPIDYDEIIINEFHMHNFPLQDANAMIRQAMEQLAVHELHNARIANHQDVKIRLADYYQADIPKPQWVRLGPGATVRNGDVMGVYGTNPDYILAEDNHDVMKFRTGGSSGLVWPFGNVKYDDIDRTCMRTNAIEHVAEIWTKLSARNAEIIPLHALDFAYVDKPIKRKLVVQMSAHHSKPHPFFTRDCPPKSKEEELSWRKLSAKFVKVGDW